MPKKERDMDHGERQLYHGIEWVAQIKRTPIYIVLRRIGAVEKAGDVHSIAIVYKYV